MVSKINKRKLENIDNKILKRRIHLQKILSILHHSNISNANYDSSNKAFFSGNIESAFKMHNKPIEGVPNKVNRNILDIYKLLGDTEKEIYIGSWTIMSVKNAIERYKELCNLNRTDIFDIGYQYMGMGHIKMISCDLNNHLLFYRPDGGSNGYDREDNLKKLLENGSKYYNKFYFSDWFYNIELTKHEPNYSNNYE
tara:strand:- start:531 stop:1121 length:591 start_codon:yes stop_codon:yes gene_type:complete